MNNPPISDTLTNQTARDEAQYILTPPGWYFLEVRWVDRRLSKKGDAYLMLTLGQVDGPGKVASMLTMLEGGGTHFSRPKFQALGVPFPEGDPQANIEMELKGKRFYGYVEHDEHQGTIRAKVEKALPADPSSQPNGLVLTALPHNSSSFFRIPLPQRARALAQDAASRSAEGRLTAAKLAEALGVAVTDPDLQVVLLALNEEGLLAEPVEQPDAASPFTEVVDDTPF